MMLRRLSLGLVVVGVLAAVAVAGGTWSDKINYRYSNGTSLKVTDPEGFKVTVTTADGDKTDTVPALFALPDQDSYVKVTLVAPDGTQWTKKVEVRAKQQAELAVQFKADAAKPEAPAGNRSFVGKFLNESGGCGKSWAKQIKADFIAGDGATAKSQTIDPHTYVNMELASGKYDVRVFVKNGDVWDYVLTAPAQIAKDGWNLGFGCPKGTRTPSLVNN
jgi:hypothetical protein